MLIKSPNGYIRCYSTEYEKSLQKKIIEEPEVLKNGLLPKFQNKNFNQRITCRINSCCCSSVINKGEEVGTGTNISDTCLFPPKLIE